MRSCTINDLDTLLETSYETFNKAYSHLNNPEIMEAYLEKAFNKEKLAKEILNPDSSFFFLYFKGELAGYLKLNINNAQTDSVAENALEIERIYVKSDFQGQGLGEHLIKKAVETATANDKKLIWLSVWEINEGAIKFYKRNGFVEGGTRDFYMADEKQTDFVMIRML
jgi:ribosomal protein S18 acetylase RimI-like enzyme